MHEGKGSENFVNHKVGLKGIDGLEVGMTLIREFRVKAG